MSPTTSLQPRGLRESLLLLQRMLDGEVLTVASAADGSTVQRAAVQRWLCCIAATIKGVERSRGSPERFLWRPPREQVADPTTAWSLAAARTMLHAFRDAMIGTVLKGLHEDLIQRLPPGQRGSDFSRMFFANTRLVNPANINADNVDRVAKAIFDSVEITLRYRNFQGDSFEERVQPWSILFSNDGVYCLGQCVESEREGHIERRRLYNLARVEKATPTKRTFAYPLREDYDPAELFRHCFGIFLPPETWTEPHEVMIRFAPSYRSFLEGQQVHRSQRSARVEPDGWTTVTLDLYVSYDLVCWVRGLGREAEPVSPPLLVEWVRSGEGADFWKAFEGAELP